MLNMKDLIVDKKSVKDELGENLEKRRKVFTEYLIEIQIFKF